MDVFRFDEEKKKSIIAYAGECQICGQCVVNCVPQSLGLSFETVSPPLTSYR